MEGNLVALLRLAGNGMLANAYHPIGSSILDK
jgi:hypothetical protein